MPRRCGYCFPALLLLTGLVVVMPSVARAQSVPGNKAVYNSSNVPAPSTAWIDASAFWTTGNPPDICVILNTYILIPSYSTKYPNGAVIDARGLYNNPSGGQIKCTGTPFDGLTASPPPTTILLPASTIPIPSTWTLPNNMKLVGEGQNTNLSAAGVGYMIEMGSATFCPLTGCSSIGIEHLVLTAASTPVGGIDNQWAQDSSYVNDVNLNQFSGTGISIAAPSTNYPGATNSGPYSNITFSAWDDNTGKATCLGSLCPVCIDTETQTRGIHGITCLGNSNTGVKDTGGQYHAGIYVNASNNSLENVNIQSFWDGIEIGNIASPVVGNVVVSNVTASTSGMSCGTTCQVTNTIHICGSHTNDSSDFGHCLVTTGTVEDVTILQATMSSGTLTTTVQDDATATSIERCAVCEGLLSTALYILGEPDGGVTGAYSRFAINPTTPSGNYGTNSTYVPTWGVGSAQPGSSCSPPGALYSYTADTSGSSIYVCTTTGSWTSIP